MKDYSSSKKEKELYIKKINKVKKLLGPSYYQVKYADGRTNLGYIESEKRNYKLKTIGGVIATSIIGIPSIQNAISGNVNKLSLGIGTIFLGATVYSFIKCINNKGKEIELKKIDYRNKNLNELKNYKKYENSLNGLSLAKKNYFKNSKNPFSIIEIDNYNKKDLEIIMSNIEREKNYKFEYNQKKLNKV